MKPFFTRDDLSSFDVRHIDSDTGKPLDVGGEPELLEVLNEKVQPVLERLAELEAANENNGIVYVKPDVFCVDTMEHEHLRKRLAAAEKALRFYANEKIGKE